MAKQKWQYTFINILDTVDNKIHPNPIKQCDKTSKHKKNKKKNNNQNT